MMYTVAFSSYVKGFTFYIMDINMVEFDFSQSNAFNMFENEHIFWERVDFNNRKLVILFWSRIFPGRSRIFSKVVKSGSGRIRIETLNCTAKRIVQLSAEANAVQMVLNRW